jgi:hypothetical protein
LVFAFCLLPYEIKSAASLPRKRRALKVVARKDEPQWKTLPQLSK